MELVYLWVEDYKNIQRQGFNFSPRFECKFYDEYEKDENGKEKLKADCKLEITPKEHIENFFGDNINVTAIVGKNGSGKSSVLEILKYQDSNEFLSFLTLYFYKKTNKFILKKELNSNLVLLKNNQQIPFLSYERGIDYISHTSDINNLFLYANHHTKFYELSNSMKFEIFKYDLPNSTLKHENTKLNFDKQKTFFSTILLDYLSNHKNDIFSPTNINLFQNNLYLELKISKILSYKESYSSYSTDKLLDIAKSYLLNSLEDISLNKRYILYIYLKFFDDKEDKEEIINSNYIQRNLIPFSILESFLQDKNEEYKELIKICNLIQNKSFAMSKFEELFVELKKFNFENIIFDLYSIYLFDKVSGKTYDHLSSGEIKILELLSLVNYEINLLKKTKSSLLLLDEIEIMLHPLWQKKIFSNLYQLISSFHNKNFHLIFTTHSPFLLSDIPKQNIIFLDTDENGNCKVVDGLKEKKQTFGANIHTLLSDSFFMDGGLMGEFAKGKIDKAIKLLNQEQLNEDDLKYCEQIISIIGEPIVENQLEKMLHYKKVDYLAKDTKEEIEFLKHRIDLLSKRL